MQDHQPDLLMFASDVAPGTTLRDIVDPDSGLRLLVTRGSYAFCAYVGVQADHSLAGLEDLRFDCHHGVNWSQWGEPDSPWAEGWYWWGWDYGHASDHVDFEGSVPDDAPVEVRQAMARFQALLAAGPLRRRTKNWTLGEVVEDGLDVLMELKQALQHTENLAALVMAR
ncbi:hypothetical protein D3C71_20800 [compost metagenome]